MSAGGSRPRAWLAMVVSAAAAAAMTSCSPAAASRPVGARPAGGPDRAAVACRTFDRALGVRPARIAARVRGAGKVPDSGYRPLDAALHDLVRGLAAHDTGRIERAVAAAEKACGLIGM